VASMHSDFFQGQTDKDLIYWPNHSGETHLFNQKEEEEQEPRVAKTSTALSLACDIRRQFCEKLCQCECTFSVQQKKEMFLKEKKFNFRGKFKLKK
jgi:hypothetical protein